MGPYVWCIVGAVVGWLAARMAEPRGVVLTLESVGVGVFGAFIGGEFLPSIVLVGPPGGLGITPVTAAMSVAGAVVCLLLLGTMRRVVGPMKPHKKRRAS